MKFIPEQLYNEKLDYSSISNIYKSQLLYLGFSKVNISMWSGTEDHKGVLWQGRFLSASYPSSDILHPDYLTEAIVKAKEILDGVIASHGEFDIRFVCEEGGHLMDLTFLKYNENIANIYGAFILILRELNNKFITEQRRREKLEITEGMLVDYVRNNKINFDEGSYRG